MKVNKSIATALFALLAYFLSGAISAQDFRLLSEARDEIVFEELTAEEQLTLASQTYFNLSDLYVNRLAKEEFYPDLGNSLADFDPIFDALFGEAPPISTAELEIRLAKIVLSHRDRHLRYTLPPPYGNFTSVLPLSFERTSRGRNPFEVRVNAVNADLFEQFAPGEQVPEVGDLVVSYNGQPVANVIETLLPTARGANTWGGFKRAMDQLTFRTHSSDLLPETDEVALEIRSRRSGGASYTVNMPWLSAPKPISRGSIDLEFAGSSDRTGQAVAMDKQEMERKETMKMAGLLPESQYPSNPTNVDELTWGVIDNRFGSFGYIRIGTFATFRDILGEVRRLLMNELRETDALILDVRNNPGGITDSAEELPQFFGGAEATPVEFQVLNTFATRMSTRKLSFGQDLGVLDAVAGTDDIFSPRFNLLTPKAVNNVGQVYFKPVGVLMNARSYSATDLFACEMQDDGRAIIYGEDLTTGAGGASVVSHNFISNFIDYFEPLPAGHELSSAYYQAVRTGPNEGELIEDFGCKADVIVSPVARDLVTGHQVQISKITRDLARRTHRFEAFSQAQLINGLEVVGIDINNPSYSINTRGTRSIHIYRDGELIKAEPVYSFFKFKKTTLDLTGIVEPGINNNIILRGVDYRGEESWNFRPNVIPVDLNIQSMQIEEGGAVFDFALAESIEPFSIFNLSDVEGWALETPFLQIGSEGYDRGLNSETVLRLDLSAVDSAEMLIDIASIEFILFEKFDIYVTTDEVFNGAKTTLLPFLENSDAFSSVGNTFFGPQIGSVEVSLNDFVGLESVYVHFRFSDKFKSTKTGMKIAKITVR